MKQKKQTKKSETIATSLNSILAVFKNVVSQMQLLEETAYNAIREEENKIAEAQIEINTLQESLHQVSAVKENISKLIEPAV